ncbi:MAG TPA: caspase family protein [Bacteroidales bacterium]|nr:caspase family protein [Bacteroidales bacterium]HSA43664.1 caspase family protein [Bacteroidales bacterium]
MNSALLFPCRLSRFLPLILLFAILLPGLGASGQSRQKALLIGISQYDSLSGWNRLHSSNDLGMIREVLLTRGFDSADIRLLEDRQATRAGIVAAVMKLTDESRPGDRIFIHFSGHGQRMQDRNGDEPDGFDEALVPFDARKTYEKGVYEGEKHLSDDALAQLFDTLRLKLGPDGSLLFTVDACFSGGISRSGLHHLVRGTSIPMAAPAFVPEQGKKELLAFDSDTQESRHSARLSVLTAGRPYQLAVELPEQQSGAFSHALATSLAAAGPAVTCGRLFEMIRIRMLEIPSQDPGMEGDAAARVFGNSDQPQLAFYSILSVSGDSLILIDGGSYAGFTTGSLASVMEGFPGDSNAVVLCRAKVVRSYPFTASLQLDNKTNRNRLLKAWVAYLQATPDEASGLCTITLTDTGIRRQILSLLQHESFIQPEGNTPGFIISDSLHQAAEYLMLHGPDGALLYRSSISGSGDHTGIETFARQVISRIRQNAMARNLLQSNLNSREIKPGIEVIRLSSQKEASGHSPLYQVGDTISFRISNRGRMACFFTILNVSADHRVNVLLPLEGEAAADYYLPAYSELMLNKLFRLTEPCGKEVYLIYCQNQPSDLRRQLQMMTDGRQYRGEGLNAWNPLQTDQSAWSGRRGQAGQYRSSLEKTVIEIVNEQ